MKTLWCYLVLAPYRALQHPPVYSMALQVGYLLMSTAMVLFFFLQGLDSGDPADYALVLIGAIFGIIGGTTGAAAQFKGLWFLERGGIFALWGAIIVRVVSLFRLHDVYDSPAELTGRVCVNLAVGFFLIYRFLNIRGADQDPKK